MCWPKSWKCCVGPSSFSLQNTDFLFSSVRNWPFQLDVWQVHMTSVLDAVLWFVIVQVNVSWMCLHLKYSDNTWCRTAKASFFSFFLFFFFTLHHQWNSFRCWRTSQLGCVGGWRHGTMSGFSDGTCCVGHHIATLYYGQERKWQDNISREISYAREHLVQCHEHRWHLSPMGQNCKESKEAELIFFCPGKRFQLYYKHTDG